MTNPYGTPPMSYAHYNAMTREDFYTFVHRCFLELNPSLKFLPNWHIEVLAAKLQDIGHGITRRLIINIPPRHLKSLAASIALPAWLLGHDPTLSIINATYGQELSDKFARDCRAIMSTAWYQAVFSTRLTSNRSALQELITTKGGSRFSTSIGGVLTGRGADVIIIDDPLKPSDAMSESRRAAANEWYDGTLYSRLNDKEKGVIVIVMQRLHEDDLVGHVQLGRGWTQVSFAAIAEVDERHEIKRLGKPLTFSRLTGEALHPERESLATLATIRSTMGTYNWAGQYQQSPAPTGEAMVKAIWFPRYVPGEQPGVFDRIVQSWDTANKPTELADYSVCTTWGIKGAHFYLLDVFRKKLSYPELRRAVIDLSTFHQPKVILIEDKASGTQLIQDLLADGLRAVTRCRSSPSPGRRYAADRRLAVPIFEINGLSKAPRLLSTGADLAAGAMLSTKLPSGSTTTVQAREPYLKVRRVRPASSLMPVSATLETMPLRISALSKAAENPSLDASSSA